MVFATVRMECVSLKGFPLNLEKTRLAGSHSRLECLRGYGEVEVVRCILTPGF